MNWKDKKLNEIKAYGILHRVPIIRDETAEHIAKLINDNDYKSLLEIGTAIGYSAYAFAENTSLDEVITIEKSEEMHRLAKIHVGDNKKIFLINQDAFIYEPVKDYDVIFIDGPKSKLQTLFEKYCKFLNKNGTIIIDNMYLNKIRRNEKSMSVKWKRQLVENIDTFHLYLKSLNDWDYNLIDIDDGVAILKKRG